MIGRHRHCYKLIESEELGERFQFRRECLVRARACV